MKKILVIEDNRMVQELIAISVHHDFGFETIQATTLEQGILYIKQESPDLIVLDLHLENIDGITESGKDILNWMKQKNDVIPTILFSGSKDKEELIDCVRIGVIDVISKEESSFLENLLESIQDFLKSEENLASIDLLRTKMKGKIQKLLSLSAIITVLTVSSFIMLE